MAIPQMNECLPWHMKCSIIFVEKHVFQLVSSKTINITSKFNLVKNDVMNLMISHRHLETL